MISNTKVKNGVAIFNLENLTGLGFQFIKVLSRFRELV